MSFLIMGYIFGAILSTPAPPFENAFPVGRRVWASRMGRHDDELGVVKLVESNGKFVGPTVDVGRLSKSSWCRSSSASHTGIRATQVIINCYLQSDVYSFNNKTYSTLNFYTVIQISDIKQVRNLQFRHKSKSSQILVNQELSHNAIKFTYCSYSILHDDVVT